MSDTGNPVKNDVENYDKKLLRKTSTKKSNILPTAEDIIAEKKEAACAQDKNADPKT